MDFLHRTPFFRLFLPLILGIVVFQWVVVPIWSLCALFVIATCLMIASFVVRKPERQYKFRWLFGSGIFLLFLVAGYFLSLQKETDDQFDHLHQKGIYRVELTAPPVEKAKSYKCRVAVMEFLKDGKWERAQGTALLYVAKDKAAGRLLFGDRLLVEADFVAPPRPLNPDEFDYSAYLRRIGVRATCYIGVDSWRYIDHNTVFSIRREADKWRSYLLTIYRKADITGDEFAVLSALTLGYTDDLQPDLMASYSATGAMHILSVSGMHVGIVYVVIAFLLGFLNKFRGGKVLKAVLIIAFLWGYAFLSGMSAAVIRAALMFSFVSLGEPFGRKSLMYNTIFASALFMLLINPNYLYDVGFQLSYSAVLSIIFFQPIFAKFYSPTNKATRWLWSMFTVSLAAQLGTAPFTLFYFQQFPNYFLLTNFLAIPLSGLVIYLALALLATAALPSVFSIIAWLLKWSLLALNGLIEGIQDLPYSVWHVSFDISQTVVVFLAIFCLSAYYFNRRFAPLFVGLTSIFLACLMSFFTEYQTQTSAHLIVYAGQKGTHISLIDRTENIVYTTDSVEIQRIAKCYWQNRKLDAPMFYQQKEDAYRSFLSFKGKRLMVLTDDYLKHKITTQPLKLDYLVIGNHVKPRMDRILECVRPKEIIVDKAVSQWYTDHIRSVCRSQGIRFYAVAEQGAFCLSMKD